MKALYKNKQSGDLFAIETDSDGKIISSCGPLLSKDLDPKHLDYDSYWNDDIKTNLAGFELLSIHEYKKLLKQAGMFRQESQKRIF